MILFASFLVVLSALKVLIFVVPGRRLAACNNPFKLPRIIFALFCFRVHVGIFQETHQLLKVLLGELINRTVRELVTYQPDPCDKIILESHVLFTHSSQRYQQNMTQGLNLPGLVLDRMSRFGGKLDHLLFDLCRLVRHLHYLALFVVAVFLNLHFLARRCEIAEEVYGSLCRAMNG